MGNLWEVYGKFMGSNGKFRASQGKLKDKLLLRWEVYGKFTGNFRKGYRKIMGRLHYAMLAEAQTENSLT